MCLRPALLQLSHTQVDMFAKVAGPQRPYHSANFVRIAEYLCTSWLTVSIRSDTDVFSNYQSFTIDGCADSFGLSADQKT